jgi:hypothetical protein
MDINSTGRLRTAEMTRRCRSRATSSSFSSCSKSPDPAAVVASLTFGTGSAALYPVALITAMRSCGDTAPAYVTLAFSVA